MPKTIDVKDVPAPQYNLNRILPVKPRKYPEILDYAEKHLQGLNSRSEAIVFTEDDGVNAENHAKVSGSLRSMAKKLGIKLACTWNADQGFLYVTHAGKYEYKPLTAVELAERRIRSVSKAELRRLGR